MTMEFVSTDSRGNSLYRESNEVGGYRYWSDEVGGIMIWDTSLVSSEMLMIALGVETCRAAKENLAAELAERKKKNETPS
jgi:hypothetical protein